MLKEEVLKALESHKGSAVSGMKLATDLSVTRSAVWKAVASLRGEGYDIRAVKKAGYILEENSDILSFIKIQSCLPDFLKELELEVYKTVDSTNDCALKAGFSGKPAWHIVVSEEQTSGRGHGSRFFWISQGEGNLS